ncbi:c-type cytochrome [Imperialibacter roseus]|jgi:cytochrome c|uniref:C-type cytochrome n=1 Tax=Imperialibacter roseus TaxID=1324217 RepID=A0ABZ0ILU1_9BACT|nr:c-type cytochrome [Imperialibacter roseus]WOK05998.1 c-type cytochrome [Imperialibacter roseus]|tara:strand:+ start:74800 stop:75276 length:477 start_codon:yes stop_codon:yes gene_type:complete
MKKYFLKAFIFALPLSIILASCGETKKKDISDFQAKPTEQETAKASDPLKNKGVGPVKSVTLGEIDQALADAGKAIFDANCTACHKVDKKFIGPSPKDILSRRSPEWVMNMILNPEVMIQEDPIAKQLLAEANGAPMANQNLTEEQARQVLEYFRTLK